MKKLLKVLKITIISILALVILVVVGFVAYMRLSVTEYYKASDKGFKIPGLSDSFIPQGLSYDSAAGDFYITGYMKDHSASPIYIVDKDTGKVRKNIKMLNPDGSEFTGHNGGIAVVNGRVFVAGSADNCLYTYDPSAIRAVDNDTPLAYDGVIDLGQGDDGFSVAFVTGYNGQIIAGEFYRDVVYPTSESHWMTTPSGATNKAIAVAFTLDGNTPVPTAVFSLPHQVQGMYVDDNNIYLSTSYGVKFSHILRYEQSDVVSNGTFKIWGEDVPLYILDDSNLASDVKIAPMSEEIEIINGRMYVMCESASDKYFFGKLTGAKHCYATDTSLFN